jgi:hypothetical protein
LQEVKWEPTPRPLLPQWPNLIIGVNNMKNKLGFDKGHVKPLGAAYGRKHGMAKQIAGIKKAMKEGKI